MTTEPSVRVVMMQRDEGALLMAWLSHYARLFGMNHLTLLDNGSTDPLTLHLLDHAAACGATVLQEYRHSGDF
ncbi:glycosyltransferase family protein [Kozakia baliensis]|uniref:Uncharacterized protein n=1 Tax=Kozakia baliensis TaxID=153496 RepID=A0A1D8UVA9_9PROT|nr:hypothetical protein [Kozakia baliensis]AOX17437.1 hypothetical protein A0U89_10125 [Kozakia baliensis]GBR30495.1 hypothetical protein AA0488_2014 [Kozakia baliensis NRIC 0488]GEL63107.1 hypothetical protein KBA01_03930 [Kozakia baliensis]